MKIRQGFVSNSSTSSYIVVGHIFENKKALENSFTNSKLKQIKDKTDLTDYIDDNSFKYDNSDEYIFGNSLGSIEYVDSIANLDKIKNTFEKTYKEFEDHFGKNHNLDITLIGIRADL